MPVDADAGDPSHARSGGGDSNDFTRLHITPFDSDLLNIVVPASIRPSARNVSYHTVETFPERRFGFVDLPAADAEKLKAKLNGLILKGTKMRIQEAVPEARIEPGGFDPEAKKKKKDKKSKERSEDKAERSSKKRKRDDNVVRGVLLTDRKVQRGWTEAPDYKQKKQKRKEKGEKGEKNKDKDKEKKRRTKSKYTEKEECLLKTTVPPDAMKNLPEDVVQDKRRKKKKGGDREFTVHEFEKTTKFPSFLKTSSSGESRKAATEFVEGKGWVDEDGTVVEAAKATKPTPKASKKAPAKPKEEPVEDSDDETSSSGTSSDDTSDDDSEEEEETKKEDVEMSEDAKGGDDDVEEEPAPQFTTPKSTSTANRPTSSGSVGSLKLQIPVTKTPPQEVHPLEALYKKKKPEDDASGNPAQASEPFTFFGDNDEDEDEDEDDGAAEDSDERMDRSTPMPMTPYTRQDLEERNIRSAAPTPDTAHPSRMRNIWAALHKNDEDMDEEMDGADEEDDDENGQASAAAGPKDAGDFQSWFWENRGDLNRSWMKRRKMAAKEKRHRENKTRASKAV
ncbi:unnamed protein product [Clonostachys rhizophaga]|uniref:Uncharacterized protein n=1 Tax=Clonostachys rhizophaga TaxID=160324 RepID=A0A9N9YEL2_9HYPO|nr:unnamed protein product [Clonostachys rhizophaga]